MEDIAGKIAIITGAGKGIGRALALALADQGVHIGLISRTEADLKSVAEEVLNRKVKASYAVADVGNRAEIESAISKIRTELGSIEILINNAGIAQFGSFMELSPARWEEIIQVNLMGTYYATRAVFPEMVDRKVGDIINITSTSGLRGGPVSSAYSASKAAMISLSESLMQEGRKHNVRVSALIPSTVVTDLAQDLSLISGDPKNVMHPEDVASLVVHQLRLNRRVFVKESQIWSTNPI